MLHSIARWLVAGKVVDGAHSYESVEGTYCAEVLFMSSPSLFYLFPVFQL
jgi:hypothetical protein